MPIPENVQSYKHAYFEWMNSNLSLAEYCQRNNISRSSFFRWGSQIAIYDIEQKPKTSFVEVGFLDEANRDTLQKSSTIKVSIGNSIKIELEDNFNASVFEKAVKILAEVSC